jgi:hypothetical protein
VTTLPPRRSRDDPDLVFELFAPDADVSRRAFADRVRALMPI